MNKMFAAPGNLAGILSLDEKKISQCRWETYGTENITLEPGNSYSILIDAPYKMIGITDIIVNFEASGALLLAVFGNDNTKESPNTLPLGYFNDTGIQRFYLHTQSPIIINANTKGFILVNLSSTDTVNIAGIFITYCYIPLFA